MASRIHSAIRRSDTVARVGGDEFVVLLTSIHNRDEAEVTLQKVIDTVREPIEVAGRTLDVAASLGISVYPDDAADCETLIRLADQAMYRAKTISRSSALPRSD